MTAMGELSHSRIIRPLSASMAAPVRALCALKLRKRGQPVLLGQLLQHSRIQHPVNLPGFQASLNIPEQLRINQLFHIDSEPPPSQNGLPRVISSTFRPLLRDPFADQGLYSLLTDSENPSLDPLRVFSDSAFRTPIPG